MVRTLTATHLHRFMTSGRTHPMLCGCEDEAGDAAGDYVVKFKGGMERGDAGLLCELLASLLAKELGLLAPEPALVVIEAEFAVEVATIVPERAEPIAKSVGLNFGCQALTGVMGWPVDRSIPEAMARAATDVFAFDALIQNPDRRFNNQNLFTRGNDIFVFDHEVAFSFLLDVLPDPEPWKLDRQSYLAHHVFCRQLRSKPIDPSAFARRLAALPERLPAILKAVPTKWNNGELERIDRHLRAVAQKADLFEEEIRRTLA